MVKLYPEKDFAVEVSRPEDIAKLGACQEMIKGTIYCCLTNIYNASKCKEYNLKFFYKFPVTTFFDLRGLAKVGVSYVRLGAPLFFQMKDVATFDIPVRLIPNRAYDAYIPHDTGIHGTWIRPEDLHLYEQYGATLCEFDPFNVPYGVDNKLIYEETMFKIYKEGKHIGRLNNLIKDIGTNVMNSILDEDFGEKRLNCGQTCQLGRCHYCDMELDYINTIEQYKEKRKNE